MQLRKFKNGSKKKDKQISEILLYSQMTIFFNSNRFPLFTAVHDICERRLEPKELINALRYHPEFW
jgi:hypothetical protein